MNKNSLLKKHVQPQPPPQQYSQLPPISELQSIKSTDTFPCYSCFDQSKQRSQCGVCSGQGFIYGNHPMVKFVDDFLSKNLMGCINGQEGDKGKGYDIQGSQGSQGLDDKNTFVNRAITRKQCRSALQSYTSRQPQPQIGSNLVKSSKPSDNCSVHVTYACNFCSVEPIRGNRYHCLECEDFDLCETCHLQIQSTNSQFQGHYWYHTCQKFGQTKPQQFLQRLSNVSSKKK